MTNEPSRCDGRVEEFCKRKYKILRHYPHASGDCPDSSRIRSTDNNHQNTMVGNDSHGVDMGDWSVCQQWMDDIRDWRLGGGGGVCPVRWWILAVQAVQEMKT